MKKHELLSWLAGFALLLSAVPMSAEQTAVVKGGRINVRGRPSLVGEVITQLQKGEKVVILEEITLSNPKTNEPAKWLRIQMPANTPVWVFAPFIDAASRTVNVSRLNLRGGPGENYSVVGRLERGAVVREIRRVEDWMEIETPPGAYAFVAADLVEKLEGQTAAAGTAPKPLPATGPAASPTPTAQPAPMIMPVPSPVQPQTPSAQQPAVVMRQDRPAAALPSPAATPAVGQWQPVRQSSPGAGTAVRAAPGSSATPPTSSSPSQSAVPQPAASDLPAAPLPGRTADPTPVQPELAERAAAPALAKTEAAPLRRIVRREGLVRSTVSIQAPTYFELLSPANRKTINYLHTEKLGLDLKDYRGRRIVVTGEEAIDPRWPRTPVIEVETLELVP